MNLLNRVRLLGLFIRLVKDPTRTELIFKAVEITSQDPEQEVVKRIESNVLAHPEFRRMKEEQYLPDFPTLKTLEALPADSLGGALYAHLYKNNLNLDLFPRVEAKSTVDYLSARLYREHDLWHALLGYDITLEDELALQAFGVAQFGSPIGIMIIIGGLINLLLSAPIRAAGALQKVVEGYLRGRSTPFLLAQPLLNWLELPIEDVRRRCQIEAS